MISSQSVWSKHMAGNLMDHQGAPYSFIDLIVALNIINISSLERLSRFNKPTQDEAGNMLELIILSTWKITIFNVLKIIKILLVAKELLLLSMGIQHTKHISAFKAVNPSRTKWDIKIVFVYNIMIYLQKKIYISLLVGKENVSEKQPIKV